MSDGSGYGELRATVARRVSELRGPVFTTNADLCERGEADEAGPVTDTDGALFELFLAKLPPDSRQEFHCHTCRRFITRFGGLVTIDDQGRVTPLLWAPDEAHGLFTPVVKALHARVAKATVTGVFLCSEAQWGKAETGQWDHLAGRVDASMVFSHPLLTAKQRMAELHGTFGLLGRALADYGSEDIATALRLLESEELFGGEKVLGVGKWLSELDQRLVAAAGKGYREATNAGKQRTRDNILWRAIATAPLGFAHVRTSMIGTLLQDIASGMSFSEVERSFRAKMHPLRYQRTTAEPSEGNIRAAEAIFAKLGTTGALARRYARIEDLQLLWANEPPAGRLDTATSAGAAGQAGVFDHLRGQPSGRKPKPAARDLPAQTMTWAKFRAKVLPGAGRIELMVPAKAHFYALVTASDPQAPPVVQWDSEGQRNPVTWYTNLNPPPVEDWQLEPGWNDLRGICLFPHQWFDNEERFTHFGSGALLVIDGCQPKHDGTGLFPSFMRSEYHAIRKTLEAHMKATPVAQKEQASACGIAIRSSESSSWPLRLRVRPKDGGLVAEYVLDRWD